MIEAPSHDLLPLLKADKTIKLVDWHPMGNQYTLRPNHIQPSRSTIRRCARRCSTPSIRRTSSTPPSAIPSTTRSARRCSCAARRSRPTRAWRTSSSRTSRKRSALLKEANYDGTPIVLLHSTDLQVLTNLAPVAKSLMEKAGFKVDMQSMDWQTVVARRVKKDPPSAGGWTRC